MPTPVFPKHADDLTPDLMTAVLPDGRWHPPHAIGRQFENSVPEIMHNARAFSVYGIQEHAIY